MAVTIPTKVLDTIRTMIGPSVTYEGFDVDLITHINSSLMYLAQMGVVSDGTKIDQNTLWTDIIGDETKLEGIKSYLYFKVKTMFDPPASATILNAYNEEIKQLEWRMFITCDERDGSSNN